MNNEIISIPPVIGDIEKVIKTEKEEFIKERKYQLNTMYLIMVEKSLKYIDPQ